MSQRLRTTKTRNRRGLTYLWIAGLALIIFLLIYFEQTAILYVFSTLAVTVLLVIVATADLGHSELSTRDGELRPGVPTPPRVAR